MTIEEAMMAALRLADSAAHDGEVPVGAIVLDSDGMRLGAARNRRDGDRGVLDHAEIGAITAAAHGRLLSVGDQRIKHLHAEGNHEATGHETAAYLDGGYSDKGCTDQSASGTRVNACGNPYTFTNTDTNADANPELLFDSTGGLYESHPVETPPLASAWNLSGCTLVVTLEPCPMCAGAILLTHIDRIVFGAWDPKIGACGSVWDIARDPHIGHKPEVIGGVRENECARLLSQYFAAKR
jgi:tRNA(adenine34) deaminase